jgi:hypothetical protein
MQQDLKYNIMCDNMRLVFLDFTGCHEHFNKHFYVLTVKYLF